MLVIGAADLDHGDAAGELRESLLKASPCRNRSDLPSFFGPRSLETTTLLLPSVSPLARAAFWLPSRAANAAGGRFP
jgi:hypothetical protein